MIRAFVGSGGKTTLIHKQAQQLRAQGKRVFVTTTTHMYAEPDTILSDDAEVIRAELERTGYVMAGLPAGEKICGLSQKTYETICQFADAVLVEADGSAGRPLKYPNAAEPVIPENAEEVIVLCGLASLGDPLSRVTHRWELARECLRVPDDTPVTLHHIAKLVKEGYLCPLKKRNVKVSVYPTGGTEEERRLFFTLINEEAP